VQTIDSILLNDPDRKKDLPVTACLPEEAGKCPVIIFSHGAGASPHYLVPLARFWAEHGYVCLMPTHSDSLRLRGLRTTLDDAQRAQVVNASLHDSKNWQERPADVSFLLDSFPDLEQQVPELEGRMNYLRVGVAGHSLGAHTAQLVGGATIDLPDGHKACRFTDPRVRAIVVLSSAGVGLLGFTASSWQTIRTPMMTMSGSRDNGSAGQPPHWRMGAFRRAPAGHKYHLTIDGAYHGSFVGRVTRAGDDNQVSDQSAIFEQVKMATLKFWHAYLKQDSDALSVLQSDALERASHQIVILHRR
jgi:predicted dienelactone hydrolase